MFCGFVTLALDYEHLRLGTGAEEHVGFCAVGALKRTAQSVTSASNSSARSFSKAQLINKKFRELFDWQQTMSPPFSHPTIYRKNLKKVQRGAIGT